MTEEEWLAVTDPRHLLRGVAGRGKARRLRLCAVACCRLIANLLPDERCRKAIDVAEAYADKRVASQQLEQVGEETSQAQVNETPHKTGAELTCGVAARVFAIEAVRYAVSTASRTFAEIAASRVASALAFSQLPPDVPSNSVGGEYDRAYEARLRAEIPI